jgi:zinc and cadmium transporter
VPAVLFLQIVSATLLVSLMSMVGILFLLLKKDMHKAAAYLISLASGTMVGTSFFHLIPECLEKTPDNALTWVGAGVFIFFILEKALVWRHCHLHQHPGDVTRPIAARMAVMGDAAHNFLDGMIIATSFAASVPIGMSVTAAIILHEIPQELGDFAILLHGGFSPRRALGINALTAVFAVGGAVFTYFFIGLAPAAEVFLLPVTAGGFLYIALADLIPQLHEPSRLSQTMIQVILLVSGFFSVSFLKHP